MQDSLYEFLLINKKLSLPGVGTIKLCQTSAKLDFTNKQLLPPSFYFSIDTKNDKPSKKLFDWLASSLRITEWDAIKSVNDFSFDLKNKLSGGSQFIWEKVGVFTRNNNGEIHLDPQTFPFQIESPVAAEKVFRENAEHTILVGEQEKSSVEMEEYFADARPKKNYAWLIAVILTLLALMFVGWYFSEKGFSTNSAGNQAVVNPN